MDQTLFKHLDDLKIAEVLHSNDLQHLFAGNKTDQDVYRLLFCHTTNGRVWVTDDATAKRSIYLFDTKGANKDKLLAVLNPTKQDLYLWSIDGMMFDNLKKCDCALIFEDMLHLVEFKANVESENPESQFEHYQKASTQLKLTFDYLTDLYRKKELNLWDFFSDIDAMIVFDRKLPQDSASQKNMSVRFQKETGLSLAFGNELAV